MDIDAGSKSPTNKVNDKPAAPDTKYTAATPQSGSQSTAGSGAVVPSSVSASAAVAPDLAIALARSEALRQQRAAARSRATTTSGPITGAPAPSALKRTASQALGPLPRGISGLSAPSVVGSSGISAPPLSTASVGSSGTTSSGPSLTSASFTAGLSGTASNSEDTKASQWLARMRAHLDATPDRIGVGRGPSALAASVPTGMDVEQIRSVPGPSVAARVGASHSDGEEEDDYEDVGSQAGLGSSEVLAALRVIADISAFNAECLSKIAGVPMPDFDDAADQ